VDYRKGGVVTSRNWPNVYSNNMELNNTIITTDLGKDISRYFTFTEFESLDFVDVYDDFDMNVHKLARVSYHKP